MNVPAQPWVVGVGIRMGAVAYLGGKETAQGPTSLRGPSWPPPPLRGHVAPPVREVLAAAR